MKVYQWIVAGIRVDVTADSLLETKEKGKAKIESIILEKLSLIKRDRELYKTISESWIKEDKIYLKIESQLFMNGDSK